MNVQLPPVIRELPGVTTTGTVSQTQEAQSTQGAGQAMVYEGSSPSAQSNARADIRQEQFAADMKANSALCADLKKLGQPADARGLAVVAGKAMRYSAAFTQMVSDAKDVSVSLGKNPAAVTKYQNSAAAFTSSAGIAPNNYGDVNYLVTRIVGESVDQNQKAVRDSVQQQIQNNLKLIDALKQYEAGLQEKMGELGASDTKKVEVAESDFQLNNENNVERVQDAAPDGAKEGTKTAEDAGPQVDGVEMSATNRPKVLYMDRTQLALEIKETQMQIKALLDANKQLQQIGSGGTSSTTTSSQQPINASWFIIPAQQE